MNIKEFASTFFGIDLTNHQMKWVKFLENAGPKCMLLAPRGHGKTTVVNLIWLSWLIVNDPTIRVLLVSHSKERAEEFSVSIRAVMENPELQEEFNFKDGSPWRSTSWRLEQSPHAKPTLTCKGAMGRMTGWRGDIVIFDDLLEINAVSSEATRKKIDNWIKSEVFFALNPGPRQRIIVVGTRKHIDDWYGQLLNNPDFECRVDRAWDSNKRPLWKAMYPREELERIYRLNGPLYFAQEMMNEPSPPEGFLLLYKWLRFYEHLPDHGHFNYYVGIDPGAGTSKDKRTSWLAICVVAHDKIYNKIYVVDLYRGKHFPDEQVQVCCKYLDKYTDIKKIYVEAVFEYTHVYNALRERYQNVRKKDYIHERLKGVSVVKKEERIIQVLAPHIELGKILFKHPNNDQYTKTFINHEYTAFPYGDFDMLDALTLAVHRIVGMRSVDTVPFQFFS